MTTTIAMYSHDSVGLGHARRNRALAFALAERLPSLTGEGTRGLLIAGEPEAARESLPEGWDWLILPAITTGESGHRSRRLQASPEEIAQLRGRIAEAALLTLAPDLLIIDRHPLGAGQELRGSLPGLRARGCRIVLGLRDVLDSPQAVQAEWEALGGGEQAAAGLDEVWIYGDESVHDLRTSGELAPALAAISRSLGYLSSGRPPARAQDGASLTMTPRPFVLTVLGGGADGFEVARRAIQAPVPEGFEHLLITGPQMPPAQIERLQAGAGPDMRVLRRVPDVPELIARARAVVSMAGYNTATEILAVDTPALMLPRTARREEQRIRARALATVGAVETAEVAEITADDLGAWFESASRRRTARSHIDRDGLAGAARAAAQLLGARSALEATPAPTQEALHGSR